MPKQNLNIKAISTIICLSIIGAGIVYNMSIVFTSLRTAKTIDEKIAKSSSINFNKANLDKALQIIKDQQKPVPEQFWMGMEEQASQSAQVLP